MEAGRWAPSWTNTQPWKFIVVTDEDTKEKLSDLPPTFFRMAIKGASACIVVCVDPKADPYHFIEDGAVATQNIALAAHSLGLGSSWVGVFNLGGEKGSAEEKIKELLGIPEDYRVISILPIGVAESVREKTRKPLSELISWNKFT